jgi:long-chain acyl-CoA synthetase
VGGGQFRITAENRPNPAVLHGERQPAVAMAGVVSRPDERLGEEVVAFVSLRPGSSATPEEITEFARGRLAAHKYPGAS